MERTRPLRILVVLEYFPPHIGGVETLFDQMTAALARDGYAVTVVTLRVPGTAVRETRRGVQIARVRTPRWARRGFFTLLAFPVALRHAFRADILHAATPNAAVPTWLAAAIARKPAVHTVHEVFADLLPTLPGLHPLRAGVFRLYELGVLRLPFAHFICVSHFTRERLLRLTRLAPSRASVIYNVIDYTFWDAAFHSPRDLRTALGLDAGAFVYLYFGRPGFLKGVEYLIDAAARVRDALPSGRLVMLLDHDPPDHYRRLRQRIAQQGLEDAIIVHDPVPRRDLPGYLLGADCVVVPSLSEGFGYAAVEAATLGCAVVTTTGHAVQEVVGEYVTLVPPRDAGALADAIITAARNPRPPRAAPRRFTLDAHVAGIASVYMRIASRRPGARR